jgi:hypothetical protein
MAKKKIEFSSLDGAIGHLDSAFEKTTADIKTYRSQVQELTGHNPDHPVTAIDVLKIVLKAFPQLQATK